MSYRPWQSLPERVGRLEATIESLIRENGELRRRVENATEAEAILRRVEDAQAPPQRRQPTRKRDRSHLHVIRSLVAAAGAGAAWVLRSRAHKAAALGLMAAVAAAGSAAAPSVIPGAPRSSVPSRAHPVRVRVPMLAPSARPRRRASGSEATPGASPASSPSAVPVPLRPEDEPSPMAPVTPLPSPSPLCTQLTDQACDHNPNCACGPDGDGDADDVLAAA